jgi:hypothetical protein
MAALEQQKNSSELQLDAAVFGRNFGELAAQFCDSHPLKSARSLP